MEIQSQADIYRFMVECSMDIVFLLDEHDRFVFLNDRVESLLGFNKQELLGKPFTQLVYAADLDQSKFDLIEWRGTAGKTWTRSIELRFRDKWDANACRFFDIKIVQVPSAVSDAYNEIGFSANTGNRRVTSYGIARDISQLKLLSNIICANANYDYLTGLPNRALLKDRVGLTIAQAKREGGKFVVMFIDLDGFKLVNDNYGHSAGDTLLQAVSARMQACLRESDTLARIGGDEFMLLLPNIHMQEEVKKIADKLLDEVSRPFVISGRVLPLSASIGVALYPDDGHKFDDLTKAADKAMYHIKNNTKNGCAFLSDVPEPDRQHSIFNFN